VQDFTSVVSYDGAISNPVIMPVAAANPGSFLELSSGSAGGVILNEDGTLNDVQNPAACGSTITIYATGLSGDHAAHTTRGPLQLPRPFGESEWNSVQRRRLSERRR